jgi:DNA repair protein SbcD/Mre11
MRILHTADWHVGRTIRGRSRADEHEAVLAEIVRVAEQERVDLVLVAGDQFDTPAPAPEAERIVYRALLDLVETGAQVVLVAGNHDNPNRLAAVRPLLETSRVRVGARLARPDDGGVVDVETAAGEVARVALLPFVSRRGIVRAEDLMGKEAFEHEQSYTARLGQVVEALCGGFRPDAVNLLVGHLMTVGARAGGGERAAHTVMEYAVPATVFPASVHYVALGHLHRPQQVPAPCPAWYAGSPLQLDFGEEADDKAVIVVDAAPGAPAEARPVRLRAGRRLRTLRGSLAELEAQAGSADGDYLRIVVQDAARAGLGGLVREWFPDAVDVVVEQPASGRRAAGAGDRRLGRSPVALFAEYLAERGAEDERVLALFGELLDEASSAGAG